MNISKRLPNCSPKWVDHGNLALEPRRSIFQRNVTFGRPILGILENTMDTGEWDTGEPCYLKDFQKTDSACVAG